MDESVRQAINDQINREFFAAYLYLAMSAHFEDEDLEGFASWMRHQAEEEVEHAMRLFQHLTRRGARVELQGIDQPDSDFGSPLSIFQAALAHEKKVTGHINDLYELAQDKNDYPAQIMLEWFIDEQVEEEEMTGKLVNQLEKVGDNEAALFMMDSRLGDRGAHEH